MLPLLPFAAGLVAGVLAVRCLRSPAVRHYLDNLRQQLPEDEAAQPQASSAAALAVEAEPLASAPAAPAKRRPRKPRSERPEAS